MRCGFFCKLYGHHYVSEEKLVKRLRRAYQKDPKRFLESDSIKIKTNHILAQYKRKMVVMSPAVTELFDNMANHVADTQAEYVTNIRDFKKVFDALVGLSVDEAAAFESGVREAIQQLFATKHSTEYSLKTNTIWIIFIANHNSTKAEQRVVIKKRLDRIAAERLNDGIPVAVYSMNYEDDGVSFEFGFLIPPDISSHVTPPTG